MKLQDRLNELVTCPAPYCVPGKKNCSTCDGTGKISLASLSRFLNGQFGEADKIRDKQIREGLKTIQGNPYKPVTTVEELVRCSECNGKGSYVKWDELENGLRGCPTCLGSGKMWQPKEPDRVIAINPQRPEWKYPDLSYWENSPYAPRIINSTQATYDKVTVYGGNRGGKSQAQQKQPDLLVPIGQRIPRKFGKL